MCEDTFNPLDILQDNENNLFLRSSSETVQVLTSNGNLINRIARDPIYVDEDNFDLVKQFIELYSSLILDYDFLESKNYTFISILDKENMFNQQRLISQFTTLLSIRSETVQIKAHPTKVVVCYIPKGATFKGVFASDYHMFPDHLFDSNCYFEYLKLMLEVDYYNPMMCWIKNLKSIWKSHF